MPAAAIGRISIPKGWDYDIGVSFEKDSKPILIKNVKKSGPMFGKLRKGYLVHGIILGGDSSNRKVEGINSNQLKSLLENTMKSTDRKLLVQVAFPEELELKFGPNHKHLKEGVNACVAFEQGAGNKIVLKKIHHEVLRKQILPGLQVGKVFFEDVGVEITGYSLQELLPCWTNPKTNVRITFYDPKKVINARKTTILPRRLDLEIPTNVADLGFRVVPIQGSNKLRIMGLVGKPSFLGAQAKLLTGMLIETLLVDNCIVGDSLNSGNALRAALEKTKREPNRVLVLERPDNNTTRGGGPAFGPKPTTQDEKPATKIPLPFSNLQIGIEYSGSGPSSSVIQITSVTNNYGGKVAVGQSIVSFIDGEGTEYSDIADYDLREFLEMTNNTRGRFLLVKEAQWQDNILSASYYDGQEMES